MWLERLLLPYDPDMVILAPFVGNDFGKYPPRDRTRLISRTIRVKDGYRIRWRGLLDYWIRRQSALGFFILDRLGEFDGADHERSASWDRDESLITTAKPYLDAISESVRRRGARFGVVVIPDKAQLHGTPAGRMNLEVRHHWLLRYLESTDVPYLDLLPPFRARGGGPILPGRWPFQSGRPRLHRGAFGAVGQIPADILRRRAVTLIIRRGRKRLASACESGVSPAIDRARPR